MRLGTYTTFDCPCISGETLEQQEQDPKNQKLLEEAYNWLLDEFDKIGGDVRKCMNSHEFGMYPSFEIDYPNKFDDFIETDCDCDECEECLETKSYNDWNDKANEIEDAYRKKFEENL